MISAVLHIVADDAVVMAREAFEPLGRLTIRPSGGIRPADLADADALVVRSGTHVDAALLEGTPVRFVGTATSGTDHIDLDWLESRGITFAAAPGCNAQAVAEYVLAALLVVSRRLARPLKGPVLGVVGCGHVGGRVARIGRALGLQVLECDPPLAEATGDARFITLDELLARADVVSLHVPLTKSGPWATAGLFDAKTISRIRNGAVFLNTARGGVTDDAALAAARRDGRFAALVIDVWSAEPEVNPELLATADLLTPHIAGYSIEGRIAGTRMIAESLAAWIGEHRWRVRPDLHAPPLPPELLATVQESAAAGVTALMATVYDIMADAERFRLAVSGRAAGDRSGSGIFRNFRREYPHRRELSSFVQAVSPVADAADWLSRFLSDVSAGP